MTDPQKFKLAFEKMSITLGYQPDEYLKKHELPRPSKTMDGVSDASSQTFA